MIGDHAGNWLRGRPPLPDLYPLGGVQGFLHQGLHVQDGLGGLDLVQVGPGAGVAGRKDGAAVLIGEDGGLEGADFSGDADHLLLVHAHQRPEHGQGGDRSGDRHGVHGPETRR